MPCFGSLRRPVSASKAHLPLPHPTQIRCLFDALVALWLPLWRSVGYPVPLRSTLRASFHFDVADLLRVEDQQLAIHSLRQRPSLGFASVKLQGLPEPSHL